MIDLSGMFRKIGDAFRSLGERVSSVFGRAAVSAKTSTLRGDLRQLLIDENRAGILAGLDKDGNELKVTKRELDSNLSGRYGAGPPLAPNFGGSRVITMFQADILDDGQGGFVLEGSWPGATFLQYHVDSGRPRTVLPIRDIVGIRPSTREKINDRVKNWVSDIHL